MPRTPARLLTAASIPMLAFALSTPAQAAPYDAQVRSALTAHTTADGYEYTATFTVNNLNHHATTAVVSVAGIEGLSCTVDLPARGKGTCQATAESQELLRTVTVAPGAGSEARFTSARTTLNRVNTTTRNPQPQPEPEVDPCNPGMADDMLSHSLECGDPEDVWLDFDSYWQPQEEHLEAGAPYQARFHINNSDWIKAMVADVSSPRFETNAGYVAFEGIDPLTSPGEPVMVRAYSAPGPTYLVDVIPTEEEVSQGWMDLPVTLTSQQTGKSYSYEVRIPLYSSAS